MKRIFFFMLAVLAVSTIVMAANPTVTTTRTDGGLRFNRYSFTYTTAIANLDTAIIGNENGTWLSIDGVGAHPSDSLITIELKSSEATADSIRHTVLVQMTSIDSPTMTSSPSTNWVTILSDATTFTNTAVAVIIKIPKLRLAGQLNKMRVLILENDANKDAVQTITGRIVLPKR